MPSSRIARHEALHPGYEAEISSGCVGHHRITGKAVAFGEHPIDVVNRSPAVAWRAARPQRQLEAQGRHFLTLRPQANETPRLTRQIVECELDGLKPQGEAASIDKAVIGRRSGCWRGR